MFVKIERGRHSVLYECDEFHVETEILGEDPTQTHLILTLERYGVHGPVRTIDVDKCCSEALGIYAMNNQGKTIDTIFHKVSDDERQKLSQPDVRAG